MEGKKKKKDGISVDDHLTDEDCQSSANLVVLTLPNAATL